MVISPFVSLYHAFCLFISHLLSLYFTPFGSLYRSFCFSMRVPKATEIKLNVILVCRQISVSTVIMYYKPNC